MLNNIYSQQIYGQQVITKNIIGQPVAYQQIRQNQQQPIYYSQNQVYIRGVYNQQPQEYNYHKVISIPGYENNLQSQNYQIQNIYQQQNNQFNLYHQNQNKNIYQQQIFSHQQVQKSQMKKQQIIMENKMIQQNSKQKLNDQSLITFTNPNIIQIKSIQNEFPIIKKEGLIDTHAKPMTKDETDDLYSYESAICKIKFKTFKDGQIKDGIGTGFFLEINDDNIPFKKALFTNNHVLNKNNIKMNKEIIFEYCKNLKKIKITENRKAFTNEKLDYMY